MDVGALMTQITHRFTFAALFIAAVRYYEPMLIAIIVFAG